MQTYTTEACYEQAVLGAVEAKGAWAATSPHLRSKALQCISGQIALRREVIRDTLIKDVGKPIGEAEAEIDAALTILAFFAAWPLWGRTPQVGAHSGRPEGHVLLKPRGVAGLITPWNYPLSNPVQKIAAALVCGNTVLWRPSVLCEASSRILAEAIRATGLPNGVFGTLMENGSTLSRRLVSDPRVNAISFTGSSEVGKLIYATASARLAAVQCEMGGKNAAVILADADLHDAARKVALGAFGFAGQKCTAISRVFVAASAAGRFHKLLEDEVAALPFGNPMDTRTIVGPIISPGKVAELKQKCEQAEVRGLRRARLEQVRVGVLNEETYFAPTIFYEVPQDDPLMQHELFGPVLAVASVRDLTEALHHVNDCDYGLAACIFTRDSAEARHFACHAEVGIVKVNQATPGLSVTLPVSGWRNSGAGIGELAEESIRFFTKSTSVQS